MALKTPVVDRVPTYPGRVQLIPVSGQTNVYDMKRADSPIEEGTPINKVLFDQKAYTLTNNVTVYVSKAGSDVTGTGAAEAPYASVQKALDSLPKCLGGYHALIDIAEGEYEERVTIDSFYGGRLSLGVADRRVVLRGINVMSSEGVRIFVPLVKYTAVSSGALISVDYGSNVSIMNGLTLHGENNPISGITASRGSTIVSSQPIEIRGCQSAAVHASSGAKIALSAINGTSANTSYAIRADMGGVVSFTTQGLTATLGNSTGSGGRILTGSGTALADASVV